MFLDIVNVLNPCAHFESCQQEATIISINGTETNSASEINEHLTTWQMGNQATTQQSTSKHCYLINQSLDAGISSSTEICNRCYFIRWNILHLTIKLNFKDRFR